MTSMANASVLKVKHYTESYKYPKPSHFRKIRAHNLRESRRKDAAGVRKGVKTWKKHARLPWET